MSNTTTRILVGLVGIPLIIFIILQGSWVFFIFIQVFALLALKEFYDIATHKEIYPNRILGFLWCIALGLYVFWEHQLSPDIEAFAFHSLMVIGVLSILTAELWRQQPSALANISVTICGVVYVAFCMENILELRLLFQQPSIIHALQAQGITAQEFWGASLVISVFAGIWICDSAAFFAGKSFGKHKLFPRVSPKKSWEGAVVGFLSSAAGFILIAQYFLPFLSTLHAAIIGALIGIMGQIGDLVESLIKRDAGVKDSSAIIPGHGGIFDRFDSMVFAAPIVLIYIKMVIVSGQ